MDATPPSDPNAPPAASSSPLWRRALPIALALALVAFTLSRIDINAFKQALTRVNAPVFLGFCAVFIVALLTADAYASNVVYRRTVAQTTFREFWILRGASYLPSILNHHLGQAILTYYISKRYGVSLARMAGGTLLVYASWMGCLLAAGAAAMFAAGMDPLKPALALGAGVVYLIILIAKPGPLVRMKVLAPLFEAGLVGHLVAMAVRIPHFIVLFLGCWVPYLLFDVHIPFATALLYAPIMMMAVTLPLTPQGVGTRVGLAIPFFARFAPGATSEQRDAVIAAATLSFEVGFTLFQAALGLFVLRRALPAMEARTSTSVPHVPAEARISA